MVYEFYYKPRNETVEVSNTHIYARYANEVSDRLRRRFGPLLERLSRLLHAVPYLLGEKLGAITKQSSEHFHIVSCDSSAQRLCLLPAGYGRKATTGEDEPMCDGIDGGDGFVSDGRLLSPCMSGERRFRACLLQLNIIQRAERAHSEQWMGSSS